MFREKKLEGLLPVDRAIYENETLIALVEIKRRSMWFGEFPDVMLTRVKFQNGITMACDAGCAYVFVVACDDVDVIYEFDPAHTIPEFYSGRSAQTRDPKDIEWCVHIPNELFVVLPNLGAR